MIKLHHPLAPYILVLGTVILQLAAALILDSAAGSKATPGLTIAASAIAVALILNIGRFIIWGYTHRHFPLSQTYPLTALFFPCILLLSYARGAATSIWEIAGTALITAGAVMMSARKRAGD